MVYNSYYTNIGARMLILLLSMTGLAFLITGTDRFFTIIFLAALIVLQVVSLFIYLNRTNRNLARFLLLLTAEDTSVISWKDKVERTFKGLHHSFRKVNEEINRIRMEKEKGTILMHNLVNQLSSGIIAIDASGDVLVVNSAALEIFGLSNLENLSDLDRLQNGISGELEGIRYDSGKVVTFKMNGHESCSLLVKVSLFRLEEQMIRVFSIHSIGSQLEAQEIESWQKMTRVLAHEISNSVTPISTLGSGIHRKLSRAGFDNDGNMKITGSVGRDLVQSTELLGKKCDALVDFIDHYKQFARIPDPVLEEINLCAFIAHIPGYFTDELDGRSIEISVSVPPQPLYIQADPGLLDLALVNLVRNSLEALKEKGGGEIHISSVQQDAGKILLKVEDSGPGIPEEIRSEVFVPFFTTRSQGTGVGLSIVRKIVMMMGGTIYFESIPGKRTTFVIKLSQYR